MTVDELFKNKDRRYILSFKENKEFYKQLKCNGACFLVDYLFLQDCLSQFIL